jgi:hypothetical protein
MKRMKGELLDLMTYKIKRMNRTFLAAFMALLVTWLH